jgi:hypothetical protein
VLVTVKKGRRSIELPHSQVVAFEKQLQRIPDGTVVIDDIDGIVVRIAQQGNVPVAVEIGRQASIASGH